MPAKVTTLQVRASQRSCSPSVRQREKKSGEMTSVVWNSQTLGVFDRHRDLLLVVLAKGHVPQKKSRSATSLCASHRVASRVDCASLQRLHPFGLLPWVLSVVGDVRQAEVEAHGVTQRCRTRAPYIREPGFPGRTHSSLNNLQFTTLYTLHPLPLGRCTDGQEIFSSIMLNRLGLKVMKPL